MNKEEIIIKALEFAQESLTQFEEETDFQVSYSQIEDVKNLFLLQEKIKKIKKQLEVWE